MQRPLSQMERLIWKIAKHIQSTGGTTVRISGNFSVAELKAALTRVKARHPWLSSRVCDLHGCSACFDNEGVPDFTVRVIEGAGDEDWRTVIAEECERPFALEVGPLVRFVLLRSAQFSDLVMVADHLLSDAFSHIVIFRDLLQQLGEPGVPIAPLPPAPLMEALLPPVSGRTLPKVPSGQPPAHGPAPTAAAGRLALHSFSLTAAETATLCERSRKERTTVYAAVCVAFIRAFAEVDQSSPVRRIETPVSLRDRLSAPVGEMVGNYVSLVETAVDSRSGSDFWELARIFKCELTRQIESEALFQRWRLIKRFAKLVPNSVLEWVLRHTLLPIQVGYDMSISNLGLIKIPLSYGPLRLEAIFPPYLRPNAASHRIMSMLTFEGRIWFSLSTMDRLLADDLKQRALHHLRKASEQ